MTRIQQPPAAPPVLEPAPESVVDNLVKATEWDQAAADLVRQADAVRPEIAELQRQLTEATNKLATLGRQHGTATKNANLHREMAEFAADRYGYVLPETLPAPSAPPAPSIDASDPLGLGRLETRGTPWSEVPAAAQDQGAEATL
jgi:hypothetical protein